jgi:phosphoglycerate dehydrogenase-like enzyme
MAGLYWSRHPLSIPKSRFHLVKFGGVSGSSADEVDWFRTTARISKEARVAQIPDGRPLTVFVIRSFSAEDQARIAAVAPQAEIRFFADQAAAEACIEAADVVAGALSSSAFARAKRLKWQQLWLAGADGALTPEVCASPVVLTSAKSNGAIPLAEHAMMLMLMLNRDARRWWRAQEERRWEYRIHPELNGLTCGIIGLGNAGQDLARKAKAFHMRVLGLRRTPQATPDVDALFTRDRLHEFLHEADFVVVMAPYTRETAGLLGQAEFQAMKSTAYYLCISRGGIANDAALLQALREGWIAGAGLDAHAVEPLPADSPFWDAPNTIITPHNGASTAASARRGLSIFIDNLRRYVAGQPLRNVVDKQAGY